MKIRALLLTVIVNVTFAALSYYFFPDLFVQTLSKFHRLDDWIPVFLAWFYSWVLFWGAYRELRRTRIVIGGEQEDFDDVLKPEEARSRLGVARLFVSIVVAIFITHTIALSTVHLGVWPIILVAIWPGVFIPVGLAVGALERSPPGDLLYEPFKDLNLRKRK